ncbi:30S ribosomal protein S4 [Tistrella bauzanensis]|jgi:small subunit ribosomal protein S4|uniref:Small ribosomal subunit protein uS4 n=2 Tax=Tistrella TaxID=171436 RepID=A0ABU9YD91_9PROT|nr:30S ribosomal protein S4 [Tistrella bauzanensis]GGB49089.1 30S ribosomal protein S4 [Tistrella bauzanensis]
MTKRIQAKHKISRRLGVNLWGTAKSPVNARAYGPGQHGQRRRKPSDYGLQLAAKQQLKGYYGNLTEKQFRRVVDEATRRKGESTENLIGLLESRLDAVVYRSNFVASVFAARQFVNHGHVAVNGRRVTIPSYRLKPGDVVSVREKSRQLTIVLEATQRREREVPDYIDVDYDKLTASYNRMPQLAEVPYPVQMDPKQIIEYYSR